MSIAKELDKTKTKKATKKAPKKSSAKKAKVDDFLSVTGATKKKKSAKKEKPSEHIPADHFGENLAVMLDEAASAQEIEKAAKRKKDERKDSIQKFLLNNFARAWAKVGVRPPTKTWKGLRSSIDYCMTTAITFSHDKAEAIKEEVGVDILKHTTVTSLEIDLESLDEDGLEALKKFLGSVDPESCVTRKLKLNSNFFNQIGTLCDNESSKIQKMLELLAPRINWNNVQTTASEEDNFDAVRDMIG